MAYCGEIHVVTESFYDEITNIVNDKRPTREVGRYIGALGELLFVLPLPWLCPPMAVFARWLY